MRTAQAEAKDVPLYASKVKAFFALLLASILCMGLLFGVVLQPDGSLSLPARLVTLLLALFLGVSVALRMLFLVVTSSPILIVERDGICLEPLIFGDNLIPWSHIRSISYRELGLFFMPRKWIYLRCVGHPQKQFHQNLAQRALALTWQWRFVVDGAIILNNGLPSMSMEQLYKELRARSAGKLAGS